MSESDMYLECRDPAHNKYRFYRLSVIPSLFGTLILTREWGRIGSRRPRRLRTEIMDRDRLLPQVRQILRIRHRHHYRLIQDKLTTPDLILTAEQNQAMIDVRAHYDNNDG